MRSSWPIVIGIAFIAAAAFWYDATNQAAAAAASRGTEASADGAGASAQVTASAAPQDIRATK
jgi:hypothetical protein